MEHTPLRDELFHDARRDPWLHAVLHHVAHAWANGYEQALRDNGLDEARFRETHDDRFEKAIEWMTEDRRKLHAQAIVAFAELGKLLPPTATRGI